MADDLVLSLVPVDTLVDVNHQSFEHQSREVSRFFWFGYLGLPPKGLLGFWQFSVYVAIVLGIPAAVIAIVEGVTDMELALFLAALFLSWALILYLLHFTGQKEARDAPDPPEGLGRGGSTDDAGHR